MLGIDEDSCLEYENLKEFYEWILSLKPKDVRAMGISKKTLWNIKHKIRSNENFKHKSKPLRTLRKLYITK